MKKGATEIDTLVIWAILAIALVIGFVIIGAIMNPGKSIFSPIFSLFS